MYEIWLGYEGDALIATCHKSAELLATLDGIADETAVQLAANGEGAEAFALHLVVREAATGDVAATYCSWG
jgi:hypothetical protein